MEYIILSIPVALVTLFSIWLIKAVKRADKKAFDQLFGK